MDSGSFNFLTQFGTLIFFIFLLFVSYFFPNFVPLVFFSAVFRPGMDRAAHGLGLRRFTPRGRPGCCASLQQHHGRPRVGSLERGLSPGLSRRGGRAGAARPSRPQLLARPQGLGKRAFSPTPSANPLGPSVPRRVSALRRRRKFETLLLKNNKRGRLEERQKRKEGKHEKH